MINNAELSGLKFLGMFLFFTRWQNEVTKFRRERRTTTRFGDTFENAYLGRGKDFFNGKDAWTENDRKKLHNLLFSLGPYRFKVMPRSCL